LVLPSVVEKDAGTERKGSAALPMSAMPPMMKLFALEGSKEVAMSCPPL